MTHATFRLSSYTQAFDNVIINLLLHIGKYFVFVQIKLKTLNEELRLLSEEELRQNERVIINRLKDIVDLHNEAINFVEQFEPIISPIMLFTYLTHTFTFCFIPFTVAVV